MMLIGKYVVSVDELPAARGSIRSRPYKGDVLLEVKGMRQ